MATSTACNRGSKVVSLPLRQRAANPPDSMLVRARSKLASIARSEYFHEGLRVVVGAIALFAWIGIALIGIDIIEHAVEGCLPGTTTAQCRAYR